jgi:3-deoxy-D-manno-octulosonic-acid transferase
MTGRGPRSPALGLYRLAGWALSPVVPSLLAGRARRGKEDPARLGERLGRSLRLRPPGALVWLHGASVGECLSLLPVIEGLRALRPDLGLVVTSGTVASAEMMARRLPPGAVHQFAPVDTPAAAARFIGHWCPDLCVFVESDLWPNLLDAARCHGARTALLSARLSPGSLRGWGRAGAAARRVLGGFDLVMAQDAPLAGALQRLGARDDGVLNLKLAGAPLPVDEAARQTEAERLDGRPLLLAASTHPGEDEIVLDAFADVASHALSPLLVLAPRHPVRGEAVTALARSRGLLTARRGADEAIEAGTQVLVADTLGELGLWFSLARLALVAGSLIPKIGGHNPLEPARLGCPFAAGPHVENWGGVYRAFAVDEAYLPLADGPALAAAWRRSLENPVALQPMAERAARLAGADDAALDDALSRLIALLPPAETETKPETGA